MSTAANISQLQSLPLPPAVSYLPQTWGWLALLLMLLGAALFFGGRAYWRWRCNRYRRAALAQLAHLQAALASSSDRSPLRQLPDLLKRTALSIPAQSGVASLGGQDWRRHSSANPGLRVSGTQIWTGRRPAARKPVRCFCTRSETLVVMVSS